MEFFGLIFLLPIALVISLFLPALIYKFLGKFRFARLAAALLCVLFLFSLVVELALIARFGMVSAHDKYYPLLDRMQGYNTIFVPLALTAFVVLLLRNQNLKTLR